MSTLLASLNIVILILSILFYIIKTWTHYNCKVVFCFTAGLVISLFIGLRNPAIGVDMPGYLDGFHIAANTGWNEIFTVQILNFERGFIIFNKLLSYISSNNQMLCIGCSLMAIMPFSLWIYKKSIYPLLSFVILVGLPCFAWYYSALRQMVAVGICVLALMKMQEKKICKFVALVLLASLFHYTAIIFLIVYPVYWFRVNDNYRVLSFIVPPIIFVFRRQLFTILKYVLNKGHYNIEETGAIGLFLVITSIYIGLSILVLSIKVESTEVNGLLNILFLACLTQLFGSVNMLASRTTFFFIGVLVIVIPCIIEISTNYYNKRIIYMSALVSFLGFSIMRTGNSSMFTDIGRYFFWIY